jgi:hypothetical protein
LARVETSSSNVRSSSSSNIDVVVAVVFVGVIIAVGLAFCCRIIITTWFVVFKWMKTTLPKIQIVQLKIQSVSIELLIVVVVIYVNVRRWTSKVRVQIDRIPVCVCVCVLGQGDGRIPKMSTSFISETFLKNEGCNVQPAASSLRVCHN